MNFVQWLNSLDELLYELMSWLIFLPVTMWRIVRHPLATMRYAENQLLLDPDLQYRGTVSPPIMLILTIVIMQGLAVAIDGPSSIIADKRGLAGLVDDNTSLLLLRLVLFGSFALVLATRKVQRAGVPLDRDTLKPPFYAQCYAISPFALLLSASVSAATHGHAALHHLSLVVLVTALLFYGVVQIRWFRIELGQSTWRSFIDASIGMISGFAITVSLGLLFG